MLWERAKSLIILFFLLLNILLAWLLMQDSRRYTVTASQENAIVSILTQNKINMYSKMIRSYAPMRILSVSGYHYEIEELLAMFFTETDVVDCTESDNKIEFQAGEAHLNVSNGYVSFYYVRDEEIDTGTVVDKDEALSLCDAFIRKFKPDFQLDRTQTVDEGLRLSYRQVYQNYIVYTNFIEFLVTANGIEQVDMKYGAIQGFSGQSRVICAPDEALLTFLQRVRTVYPDTPMLITMDIVYNQEESSNQENIILPAKPYYRILIENKDVPFLIDATTNTCIN